MSCTTICMSYAVIVYILLTIHENVLLKKKKLQSNVDLGSCVQVTENLSSSVGLFVVDHITNIERAVVVAIGSSPTQKNQQRWKSTVWRIAVCSSCYRPNAFAALLLLLYTPQGITKRLVWFTWRLRESTQAFLFFSFEVAMVEITIFA